MPVYKYKSYDEYKKVQIDGNRRKIDFCWAKKYDIEMLSKYIKKKIPDAKFGICHGTRRGKEQEWFREYLGIEVIGTEISPTAAMFPHTIEWDFHRVKEEWVDNVDFIYSNSFDHSYKPKECLDSWMSCVKKDGFCIIEWSLGAEPVLRLDPYGANLDQYKQLINEKYVVDEVIQATPTQGAIKYKICFLIAKHRQ